MSPLNQPFQQFFVFEISNPENRKENLFHLQVNYLEILMYYKLIINSDFIGRSNDVFTKAFKFNCLPFKGNNHYKEVEKLDKSPWS